MNPVSAIQRVALLLVLILGLSGCAGVRLYDASRDAKGQAASKAWAEVKLDTVIATERANLEMLLAAEAETQDKLALALREYELRQLFSSSSINAGLKLSIESRLASLVGDQTTVVTFQAARVAQRSGAARFAQQSTPLRLAGLPTPTCDELVSNRLPELIKQWQANNTGGFQSVAVRTTVEELTKICREPRGLSEELLGNFGGQVGAARDEASRAIRELGARKEVGKTARETFEKTDKAHSDAVALTVADATRAAKVKAASEDLAKASAALAALGDAFSVELISNERLRAIGEFANVIVQTSPSKDPPANAGRAAKAAALLPELFDEAEKSFAAARKPMVLPWTLQREHQQLNLEAARRDIAASEAVVRLSAELIEVLLLQAESLALALDELKGAEARLNEPALTVLRGGTTLQKQAVLFAATRYLDAIGRLDSKRYRTEYARLSAYHQRSLSLSEINVKQWESLIGIAVAQLAEDSAAGFKPEDFSSLLNTLGIFYIGRGVNK